MSAQQVPHGSGREGEGGSLYSGMKEGVNSLSPSFQKGDGVGSVLLAFGVFALSPSRRIEVEERSERLNIADDELHGLLCYVREGEPRDGTARRYMAAIVSDDVRLRNAVEGFREFRKRQAAAVAKPAAPVGPPHMVNLPMGTSSCPCAACEAARGKVVPEPWDHDRQCRVAYCLVYGDRKPLQQVAELLGISETTLRVMLDRGRSLSAPATVSRPRLSAKQAALQDRGEQERRNLFARQMRELKAVPGEGHKHINQGS